MISTHTPLARRDILASPRRLMLLISTHTPLARRDGQFWNLGKTPKISTHTPLARRDRCHLAPFHQEGNFYSHASCEARRLSGSFKEIRKTFLLTRLLRGATKTLINFSGITIISTHTPLARRDTNS